jgi:hypothetical protein
MQKTLDDAMLAQKHAHIQAIAQELDRRCKSVALAMGRSETAVLIDRSVTYVNEMVNCNNEQAQKPWQLKYLPALILGNRELFISEVLNYLNELAACEPAQAKRTLTTEEELAEIRQTIKKHGLEALFHIQ